MNDVLISANDISKTYRIWRDPAARLKAPIWEALGRALPFALRSRGPGVLLGHGTDSHYYHDFHALKNLSFDVRKGDAIGIIGRNGSGKSTLLQILTGTLRPSTGEVARRGRIAALLELGSGFNPDFTGRENALLNASILGLDRAEIEERMPEIIEFAEIGDFIDQPVKTYSSGMLMRLAFSVQIAVRPEVLIVDEALSVGDAAFVAKCINRVSDFLRSGGTLLFVSHDIGLVRQLTQKCLYLENGHAVCFDQTAIAIAAYQDRLAEAGGASVRDPDSFTASHSPMEIGAIRAVSPGYDLACLPVLAPFQISMRLDVRLNERVNLVASIYNYMGLIVVSRITALEPAPAGSFLEVKFNFEKLRLAPGPYRMNFAIRRDSDILCWRRNALQFTITGKEIETYIYRENIEVIVTHSPA